VVRKSGAAGGQQRRTKWLLTTGVGITAYFKMPKWQDPPFYDEDKNWIRSCVE